MLDRLSVVFAALLPALLPAQDQKPQPAEEREFPADWFWHSRPGQWEKHAPLLGKPLPALDLSDWRNGDAKVLEAATGKVVVLDFWATWCGPCIASIPHNHEMVEKYAAKGMVFVAVCGSNRGQEKMDKVLTDKKVTYPVARDAAEKSAKALAVQWWPTYAVVDRAGKVRAIGLKPDAVDKVVEKLLAEPAPAGEAKPADAVVAAKATILPAWLEGNPQRETLLAQITDKPAPALEVTTWANSEPADLSKYAGKVVMLDFWATWCGPCIASIPHNNELQKKYADQGLVVLGVCHPKGGEKMAETVKDKGMEYATALDAEGKTIAAYGANSFPDYYFIDRKGVLRIADCSNGSIEDAIKALLAESGK
jgi:cytochrome c biogenesis protein CcmG/thiol:disulfide interchange protein DsbE